MNLSQKGLDLIKKFEGLRLTAYQCPSGVWTIGYGHIRGVSEGMTITSSVAEVLLLEDCNTYVTGVNDLMKKYKYNPTQAQFDAMVSFSFNCGCGALKECLVNLQWLDKELEELPEQLILYNKSKGKVLQGLVNRRSEEIKLFNSKEYQNKLDIGIQKVMFEFANYGQIEDGCYVLDCGKGYVMKVPCEYIENNCNYL